MTLSQELLKSELKTRGSYHGNNKNNVLFLVIIVECHFLNLISVKVPAELFEVIDEVSDLI